MPAVKPVTAGKKTAKTAIARDLAAAEPILFPEAKTALDRVAEISRRYS